jgi:hypothetical protein
MKILLELSEQQLDLLVANKSRFESLRVGGMHYPSKALYTSYSNAQNAGLVKKNMGKTSELSAEQETVMLQKTPADLQPEAEKLAARRKAPFEKATAAFAQSVGGEDQAEGEDDSD